MIAQPPKVGNETRRLQNQGRGRLALVTILRGIMNKKTIISSALIIVLAAVCSISIYAAAGAGKNDVMPDNIKEEFRVESVIS